MLSLVVAAWGVENLILSAIAYRNIRKNSRKLDFIYGFAYINGAFVWEDMFVFGLFHAASAAIGIIAQDLRYSMLLFVLFWCVRSTGETLYFFLQQFIEPKHHPHNISAHFIPIRRIFGSLSDQKSFILLQVFFQTVCCISLFSLILILMNWHSIGVLTQ